MYCKHFLIKYFLNHVSVLFVYNNVFQFFKFFKNSGFSKIRDFKIRDFKIRDFKNS